MDEPVGLGRLEEARRSVAVEFRFGAPATAPFALAHVQEEPDGNGVAELVVEPARPPVPAGPPFNLEPVVMVLLQNHDLIIPKSPPKSHLIFAQSYPTD